MVVSATAVPPWTNALTAYWRAQPRAVRVFSPTLEVLWDNTTERARRYPLFADARPPLIPPPGPERNAWPVARALAGESPASRNYWVRLPDDQSEVCLRVQAWTFPTGGDPPGLLVAEEIERVDRALCHDERLRALDHELADLIRQVAQHMMRAGAPELPRLRIENPNLQPCYQIRACDQDQCPAREHPENLRCWEIPHTLCHDGMDPSDALEKFMVCDRCNVLRLACPDPLTRVGENFNRLLMLLELKYHEALAAHREVQQAERLAVVGELALGIAHEIKNPLSVILARLDCLSLEMDAAASEQVAEDLRVIRHHGQRMRQILDDLLQLARPARLQPVETALEPLIRETIMSVRTTLGKAGIDIAVELENDLPPLRIEPRQVQQVLLNLIVNARDAMRDGGRLTVRAKVDRDARRVVLEVSDTGPGIAPELHQQIFSPFFSTKFHQGGTGLGLTICRRIMAQHGGSIEVVSAPGQGATFRLNFPLESAR